MEDELYHHGRLHQKWGVKNGPPYPLDSEKTKGYAKKQKKRHSSIRNISTEDLQKKVDRLDKETTFKKKYAARYVRPSKGLKNIEKAATAAQKAFAVVGKKDASSIAANVATISKSANTIKTNAGMTRVSTMNLSKYNDDFLKKMSDRLDLEKRYLDLKSEEVNTGKSKVETVVQGVVIINSVNQIAKAASKNSKSK